jgi:hypothetical protein
MQDLTIITRSDWYTALGNIGGVQGFVFLAVAFCLKNFTDVDFLTTMIKGLFL